MKARIVGLIGAVAALCGCASSDHDSNRTHGNDSALVGSYPTRNGGRLEIFEPEPGQFLIGELSHGDDDAAPLAQNEAPPASGASLDTLGALYQRMVGGAVPAELRAADARMLAAAGQATSERTLTPSYVHEVEPVAAVGDGVIEKDVDRAVAAFRTDYCRTSGRVKNTDACQSFNYCRTEVTNDKTFVEDGLYGAYSVVRPYRGSVVMEVLYNDKVSFSRTLDEGSRYRAWRSSQQQTNALGAVTPGNPPFKLETRVRGAEGDGFHVAVLGTRSSRYWNAYDDASESANRIGCAIVLPENAPRGALVGVPLNW